MIRVDDNKVIEKERVRSSSSSSLFKSSVKFVTNLATPLLFLPIDRKRLRASTTISRPRILNVN